MALTSGTKLGPYEIIASLSAGGMGEVYRARDTRLGREVVVKTLTESFAAYEDHLRRFEQEAAPSPRSIIPTFWPAMTLGCKMVRITLSPNFLKEGVSVH